MPYFMTQWYIFTPLTQADILRIQQELREIGKRYGMNGLILLAEEGCNGTVAGSREAIQTMKDYVIRTFGSLRFQDWQSDVQPFKRFKVDIREEIVALKKNVSKEVSTKGTNHLSPQDFHTMMEKEDVTVLDTRNTYESAIGTFENAIVPPLQSFQEFPKYIQQSTISKEKPVLMFCTSGIRCEKASEEMRSQGYKKVYQLDGGITNYLKEFPDGKWEGECFMFDHRVAVDKNLKPSARYSLCPSCGNPGDVQTTCEHCHTPCTLCTACVEKAPIACSRACKHALTLPSQAT